LVVEEFAGTRCRERNSKGNHSAMAAGGGHAEHDEEDIQGGPMPEDEEEGSALPESVRSALMMDRSRALMSGACGRVDGWRGV
jgi:hypothetical protein